MFWSLYMLLYVDPLAIDMYLFALIIHYQNLRLYGCRKYFFLLCATALPFHVNAMLRPLS
jgi:hypothetical protein